MTDAAIAVHVITGFLGAGKTTLLKTLLAAPDLNDTAVLVNEFGEVGLDQHLLHSATTPTLLMDNGCVCCAVRGDLKDGLQNLYEQRERGQIPHFRRVVVETSGLADPAPIVYTLLADPVLRHHYYPGNVIALVDAVNGADQLDRFEESVKQAALADCLVITKTDLITEQDGGVVGNLKERLRRLNLSARMVMSPEAVVPSVLFGDMGHEHDADGPEPDGRGDNQTVIAAAEPGHRHTDNVHSFVMHFDEPMDWTAFGVWMTMLLNRHGDRVLRIKGMLNVLGVETPVLINGVQHIVHPPVHLQEWPDGDRRSRIIFIVHQLERRQLERSLTVFRSLASAQA